MKVMLLDDQIGTTMDVAVYYMGKFVLRFLTPMSILTSTGFFLKFGDKCFLEIGDNNDIREHVSIHRSSKTTDNTVR